MEHIHTNKIKKKIFTLDKLLLWLMLILVGCSIENWVLHICITQLLDVKGVNEVFFVSLFVYR